MRGFRRFSGRLGGAVFLLAAVFFACEKVPEHCGDGKRYNPGSQFCFDGTSIDKCGGKDEYNPTNQRCDGGVVQNKCADGSFVAPGASCDVAAYTLTTTAAPANGGSITRVPDEPSYAKGTTVAVIAAPDSGYEFVGWVGAATSTSAATVITMDAGKSLIAMFKPISVPGATVYTLTTTAIPHNGGSILRTPDAPAYEAGALVAVTAMPANGYKFTGWAGVSTSTSATVTITMDGNKPLVAMFDSVTTGTPGTTTYTLAVNASPAAGGTVSRSPNLAAYDAGTQVTVTAAAAQGYEFNGWTGATTSANNQVTITMDGNKTLTASFREQTVTPGTYKLTVNINPTGSGTVTPASGSNHAANTPIAITASPTGNNSFVKWTVAGGGTVADTNSASTTVTLTADATVTANFKEQTVTPGTYKLTVNIVGGGTVERSPNRESYNAGTQVAMRATQDSGYVFTEWTGAMTSDSTQIMIVMNNDITLTANFEPLTSGTFIDSRDTRGYRWIKIGKLTWMAENLSYETDSSLCYGNDFFNCVEYGRLYNRDDAMTACPAGWRLSTGQDWDKLVYAVGGSNIAGKKLKSKTGWSDRYGGASGNGTDEFGFSALPGGGYYNNGPGFNQIGTRGSWWSVMGTLNNNPLYRNISGNDDISEWNLNYGNQMGFSIRCVKN